MAGQKLSCQKPSGTKFKNTQESGRCSILGAVPLDTRTDTIILRFADKPPPGQEPSRTWKQATSPEKNLCVFSIKTVGMLFCCAGSQLANYFVLGEGLQDTHMSLWVIRIINECH